MCPLNKSYTSIQLSSNSGDQLDPNAWESAYISAWPLHWDWILWDGMKVRNDQWESSLARLIHQVALIRTRWGNNALLHCISSVVSQDRLRFPLMFRYQAPVWRNSTSLLLGMCKKFSSCAENPYAYNERAQSNIWTIRRAWVVNLLEEDFICASVKLSSWE